MIHNELKIFKSWHSERGQLDKMEIESKTPNSARFEMCSLPHRENRRDSKSLKMRNLSLTPLFSRFYELPSTHVLEKKEFSQYIGGMGIPQPDRFGRTPGDCRSRQEIQRVTAPPPAPGYRSRGRRSSAARPSSLCRRGRRPAKARPGPSRWRWPPPAALRPLARLCRAAPCGTK